jgi:hypothetical protein
VFLCITLALPLATQWRYYWAAVLAVISLLNYVYFSPSAATVVPSGRLIASALLLKDKVKRLHGIGKGIASLSHKRVAIIGGGKMHPYFTFEALRHSTCLRHEIDTIDQRFEVEKQGDKRWFLLLYRTPETGDLVRLANHGYFLIFAAQKGIESASDRAELQGKWASLDDFESGNEPVPVLKNVQQKGRARIERFNQFGD